MDEITLLRAQLEQVLEESRNVRPAQSRQQRRLSVSDRQGPLTPRRRRGVAAETTAGQSRDEPLTMPHERSGRALCASRLGESNPGPTHYECVALAN